LQAQTGERNLRRSKHLFVLAVEERIAFLRDRIEECRRHIRQSVDAAVEARCRRQIACDEAELDEIEAAKWGPRWA
jgi:hypothetical protein